MARDAIEQPYADLIERLTQHDEVEVSEAERVTFVSWASRLPGWGSGPDHARHPLLVREGDAKARKR